MSGRFEGKVAVVTDIRRGVAGDIARLLAEEGASLVVNDPGFDDGTGSSGSPADEIAEEVRSAGGTATAAHEDVASMNGGERLIAAALDGFGRLDVLVNSVGLRIDGPVHEMAPEDFDRVVTANVKGTFVPTKYAAIHFRQQRGGRIVCVTSDAGLGEAGASGFAAASEAIVGLTRTVARDLGKYGVSCNAVCIADQEDGENVARLAVLLCTEALPNVNGYAFGAHGGSIYVYSNPTIRRSIHKWGTFTMDEMDSLAAGLIASESSDTPAAAR